MKIIREGSVQKPENPKSEKKFGEPKGDVYTEQLKAIHNAKYGIDIKCYPFSYRCPHCGESSKATYNGEVFVNLWPMQATKQAFKGKTKKRVNAAQTELQAEESY